MNFSIFLHPGHSYSNLPPINYWGKFPTQANFLKRYTYADRSDPSVVCFVCKFVQRKQHIVFCFVSSYKEANLLPIIALILQK